MTRDRTFDSPSLPGLLADRRALRNSKVLSLVAMTPVWRTLTSERVDVVISSSHAFAHTVKLGYPRHIKHLSYIHSPARHIWSPDLDGRGSHPLFKLPRAMLQRADVRLSRHVDAHAANSREVQGRIKRFWKRNAVVINPPVEVGWFGAAPVARRHQYR